jgi:hypothetical protein
MSASRPRPRGRQTTNSIVRWGMRAAVAIVALGVVAWLGRGQLADEARGPNDFPGPRGGSNQSQDVNTLVGQPAQAFTLADSEGMRYTVTPGRGRPLVLVSHMGIT